MHTTIVRGVVGCIAILGVVGCSEGASLATAPDLSSSAGPLMELVAPTCRTSPTDPISVGAWTCREAPATVSNVTFEDFVHNQALTNSLISGARFVNFAALKEATAGGTGLFGNAPSGTMVAYWICTSASPPPAKCANDYSRRIEFIRPVNEITFQYAAVIDPLLEDNDLPTLVILEAYSRTGTLLTADTGAVNNPSVTPIKNWGPMGVKYGTDNHIYYVILRGSPNRVGIDDFVTWAVNHAPVAKIVPPATAAEGATLTFSGAVSYDPARGTDDGTATDQRDVVVSYQWSFGGGLPVTTTVPAVTHSFTGSGPQTVTLTVTDPNGVAHTTSQSVAVANRPPVITLGTNPPAPAGQPFTLQATFTDPGVESYWTYEIDWGTGFGAPDTLYAAGAIPATRALGPGTHTVKVRVTDADGASDEDEFTVVIPNTSPVARFTLDSGPVNEGAEVTYDGTLSSSPSNAALTYAWTFGDGGTSTAPAPKHRYADEGTYTVRLVVADAFGGTSTAEHAVVVVNVAPTATFVAPSVASEGSAFQISLQNATDAGSADVGELTYEFDCGDGPVADADGVAYCTPLDDGTLHLTGIVRDADGGERVYTRTVTVSNVPPTLSVGGAASLDFGFPFQRTATVADPGTDPVTVTVNYGDGSPAQSANVTGASFTLSRSYAAAGSYTVTVTANDGDGGITTASFTVTVAPPLAATVRIEPESIKRNQLGSGTITVFVDSRRFDVASIDLSTVTLGDRSGQDTPLERKNNGSYEVTFSSSHAIFKFDRARLLENGDLPSTAGTATLYLRGQLRSGGTTGGQHFEGSDQVSVIP